MRKLKMIGATGALILATMAFGSPAQAADAELLGKINTLTVAGENSRTGYDRDLFGTPGYDRQALLAENFADWPECDGYLSEGDNECYTAASDVDVDHIVPLGEAWDSGASEWTDAKRKEFGSYETNFWLLTDNLNSSKGDDDAAEWLPPYEGAVCGYATTYVDVKVKFGLTVDDAEKAALVEVAEGCDGEPTTEPKPTAPTAAPTTAPATAPTTAPAAPGAPGAGGGDDAAGPSLPVTGDATTGIAIGAAVLLAVGGVLFLVARRRRVTFTA